MSKHYAIGTAGIIQALKPFTVITSRYRGDGNPLHIISTEGEYFKADNEDLRLLRNGSTPDDLELCPCADSFDEDE